jgi:hypothetical protein
MRAFLLIPLLGLVACAPKRTPAFAAEAVPCPVAVDARAGQPWQQVVADGFTFCVPASWRAGGESTLRGDGGWIRWGGGEPRRTMAARTITVTVPAGQGPPVPPGRQHRFSETIGGALAELWDNELECTFYTGAQLRQPKAIHLLGQSSSQSARATQLQVYRTVRFTAQ